MRLSSLPPRYQLLPVPLAQGVVQLVGCDGFLRKRVVLPPVDECHYDGDQARHQLLQLGVVDGQWTLAKRAQQLIRQSHEQTNSAYDGRRRDLVFHDIYSILNFRHRVGWMGRAVALL